MTKKSFIIIAILSFITAHVADLVYEISTDTLLKGPSGFPFKDDTTTILGGGSFNYYAFTLNIIFWFIVITVVWKIFQKVFKK
ncbi:MAG: hypothetical protein HW400_743 [Candidatus Levybacteria bacterium]|nr:hypothetical protein [Candidatus Levybacteria bacterium]